MPAAHPTHDVFSDYQNKELSPVNHFALKLIEKPKNLDFTSI